MKTETEKDQEVLGYARAIIERYRGRTSVSMSDLGGILFHYLKEGGYEEAISALGDASSYYQKHCP